MTLTAEQAYYAREADRQARGPQLYGGDASIVALRCFQRYHRDATSDITDGQGMTRWVTKKQARVFGILHRVAMSATGASTMHAIAVEAGVTPSTVSRTIHKLEAWEMYAVEVRRGKYGGITVHRKGWDRFFDYVREARRKLSEARIRAQSNVASIIRGGKQGSEPSPETSPSTSTVMDATLKRPSFASRVAYERAMLALNDPEGEYEAVRPLIGAEMIDYALLLAEDVRRRRDEAIREAAFRGDWTLWEHLRSERWDD
jgi:DNA-binding MarR family transcriptional regulator